MRRKFKLIFTLAVCLLSFGLIFAGCGKNNNSETEPVKKQPHSIVVDEEIDYGAISTNKDFAVEGETIELTVYPDVTYVLKEGSLTYTKLNDESATPVQIESLSFVMPDYDIKITATFERVKYNVTLPTSTAYRITDIGDQTITSFKASHGSNFVFKVVLEDGYTQSTPIVKQNGKVLTPDEDGIYSLIITEAKSITVEGLVLNTYTISFPENVSVMRGETPLISGDSIIHGDRLTISYEFESDSHHVSSFKANTVEIENGETITATSNLNITIETAINVYSVTFLDDDDITVLNVANVEHGNGVEYVSPKQQDSTYFYTFNKWVDENGDDVDLTEITSNMTVYATYNIEFRKYTITFYDDSNNVISTKTDYHYGDEVIIPEDPTKESENPSAYTYIFTGWVDENGAEVTITNVFDSIEYFATFVRSDFEFSITIPENVTVTKNGDPITSEDPLLYGDLIVITYQTSENMFMNEFSVSHATPTGNVNEYSVNGNVVITYTESSSPRADSFDKLAFNYDSGNNTASVSAANTSVSGEVVIPASVYYNGNVYNVTTIAEIAFEGCSNITSVTIPSSITNIVGRTFVGCSALASIIVDAGNTTYYSENNCLIEIATKKLLSGCKNSVVPNDILIIGKDSFNGMNGLTSITFPEGLTKIEEGAFYYCTGLTSVHIPSTVTVIGISAFQYCRGITTLTFAANSQLTTMEEGAFQVCDHLTSVIIPASVQTIGEDVFLRCFQLANITFEANSQLESIGWIAFKECPITSIVIPAGVKYIANGAFQNCNSLTSITFENPNGWTAGSPAISASDLTNTSTAATYLKTTYMSQIWTRSDANYLTFTPDDSSNPTSYSVSAKSGVNILGTLVIPSTYNNLPVTTIPANAFQNKTNIRSVVVPGSVTSIGAGAFGGCSALEEITIPFVGASAVPSAGPTSLFGYIFGTTSYGLGTTQLYSATVEIVDNEAVITPTGYETFAIPSSLKTVNVTGGVMLFAAFSNCTMIEEINIQGTVPAQYFTPWSAGAMGTVNSQLGLGTFYGCTNLETLTLCEGIVGIEFGTCYGCSNLESVSLPSTLTYIGYAAFNECSSLNNVEIPANVATIGDYAFFDNTSLTNLTFAQGSHLTTIGQGSFQSIGETSIIVPNSVTTISDYAFSYNDNLESIVLGANITTIGRYILEDCPNLTIITVDENNAKYTSRDNSGVECNAIIDKTTHTLVLGRKTTIIPNDGSVTAIGDYAFAFSDLTGVLIIPEGILTIGDYAFNACSELTSVSIPASVTSIGTCAFQSKFTDEGASNYQDYVDAGAILTLGSDNIHRAALTSLTTVIFAEGSQLTSLPDYMFHMQMALTTVNNIPNTVESIGWETFGWCSSLANITLPTSLKTLDGFAFQYCAFETITLPEGLETIALGVFQHCTSLTAINIPASVTTLGGYYEGLNINYNPFVYCPSLANVTFGNTNGWTVTAVNNSSTAIDSSSLANPTTAATYLKSTYVNHIWTRAD